MSKISFSPEKKDRKKKIRSILQGIFLILILIITIKALFSFTKYDRFSDEILSSTEETGFIALSYFGVDRDGNNTLISTKNLEAQLEALKNNGYVTIEQQDILDYYNKGKKLPSKSLFLLFEDGRRDTAIFAQKIMEKLNFKGTILTYGGNLISDDPKFLDGKDLLDLAKSTFWELGTNGYRLSYINVFNKESQYLGELDSLEFSKIPNTIDREYNHYLMDYIRDEYGVPKETYEEMNNRIDYDYEEMCRIYESEIYKIPSLYALMHANTGKFGTNDKVSSINEKWINELFNMNFNREGFSLNNKESSIYDLTRIQPQSYWSTNHLLMRIWDDTKSNINFIVGDEKKAFNFEKVSGEVEFVNDKIILTSMPKGRGVLKLKTDSKYKNVTVSTILKGNIIGSQGIHLRANDDQSKGIYIQLQNNHINIFDDNNKIYSFNLSEFEENKDKEKFDIKDRRDRLLDVKLYDNKITVIIDDKIVVEELEVKNHDEGDIFLESAWGEYGYSQRNLADDVYDGIFERLKVMDEKDNVIFDSSLTGIELLYYNINKAFNSVLNWFIKHL